MTTKNCANVPKLVLKDLCEKSFVRNVLYSNIYIWKFDTHRILSCIGFIDRLLKVFITMQCWLVNIILDLFMTVWKLSSKLRK